MTKEDPRFEALIRKIRALKAKADSPGVTEAESMAFMEKVTSMLAQHNLEIAQLEVEEQSGIERDDFEANWQASPTRRAMFVAVCALYMVRPLTYGGGGKATKKKWTLVGRKVNVYMAKDMAEYLLRTVIRLSNEHAKRTGGDNIDFRRGCFTRLTERLYELKLQQERAAAPAYNAKGNPENLPALRMMENDLINAYLKSQFGKLGQARRSRGKGYGLDGMAGYQAGNNISLNRQVSGKSSKFLLK